MDEKNNSPEKGTETAQPVVNAEPKEELPEGVLKEFILPSGKKARIYAGKGSHCNLAMEIAAGDQKQYLPALMHLLIEVDGEKLRPDELTDMPMKDYLSLQGEFASQNF